MSKLRASTYKFPWSQTYNTILKPLAVLKVYSPQILVHSVPQHNPQHPPEDGGVQTPPSLPGHLPARLGEDRLPAQPGVFLVPV